VPLYERALNEARLRLDEATFTAAWMSGRELALDDVVTEALALPPHPASASAAGYPRPATNNGLTSRELDVLRLLAQGFSDRQIGDTLHISPQTAATHVKRLRAKLGAPSRTAAAAHAVRYGLV
jgi:DNA-binding NarL/FixJ family response regulator